MVRASDTDLSSAGPAGSAEEPHAENARRAWQHYAESRQLRPELLRDATYRAWKRCHALGASHHALAPRTLSPRATAALLEREERLIEAARPYLRALSQAAGRERHAATLADAEGTVLDVVGDEETVHSTPGFPGPGAVLSEAAAGANGIGTAIAEGVYVELIGPEHFMAGLQGYTCQGLPLRGPEGAVIGALATSVHRIQTANRIHEILICAAHGIEAELTHEQLERDVAHVVRESTPWVEQVELLRQDVVQLHSAGRLRLENAVRAIQNERPSSGLELVTLAERLIERFRRKAALWRDIAAGEVGAPQPVDLQGRVLDMVKLLRTELAIRQIRVSVRPHPPVHVLVDSRQLSRTLFHAFMQGLAASPLFGTLDLEVQVDPEHASASCLFSVADATPPPFPLARDVHPEAA